MFGAVPSNLVENRLNSEGERSGSGRLSEVWRLWICSEAGRAEWQDRRHSVYPDQMPRLRRNRPEARNLT